MNDQEKAKRLFETGKYTCVLCRKDAVFTSVERGVKPLLNLLESGGYGGFSAADKIVGQAAAHLYILIGVVSVYASVMSRDAEKLLLKNNISASYGVLTEKIINRNGNDICPMEKAVSNTENSHAAVENIKKVLSNLNGLRQ